ncbi:hypothetical protein K466DRAFT_252927 [Polyporus arcularius HHB13444]|uniref:Uncharacterized protein n=1 Tax=Polyporus arcularius HHB13444 TaxID=1314778 RepID=A0A5C3P232_9APHY|nr:hypothetical protein K466DRAFT_252927 [Polyporus arcularius HHB13444]
MQRTRRPHSEQIEAFHPGFNLAQPLLSCQDGRSLFVHSDTVSRCYHHPCGGGVRGRRGILRVRVPRVVGPRPNSESPEYLRLRGSVFLLLPGPAFDLLLSRCQQLCSKKASSTSLSHCAPTLAVPVSTSPPPCSAYCYNCSGDLLTPWGR